MLSVSPISAAGAQGMAGYLEGESAAVEDYYAGENDAGKWATGDLAQALGLEGELKRGQLLKMLQGYHPETGEPLAKNAGPAHKAGWDLTFSAPKSVSAIWAVAPRELRQAIEAAQAHAATEGLQFIQEQGGFSSRSRQNPEAVNILAAQFQHGTSRAMDPDLHTHTVVANLCKTREGFQAVDFDTGWKMASGAVYRASLANRLQELGFSIESDGTSFKVAGVPDELCKTWSKRRNQIQAALAAQGREGTALEASVANLATRVKKQKLSREELFFSWRQQAAEHGLAAEELRNLQAEGRGAEPTPAPDSLDPLSDGALLASLTEHESMFTRQRLFQVVATAAQGRLDKAGIEARVTQLLKSQELMKLRARPSQGGDPRRERQQQFFTTKEMWQLETGLAKRGLDLSQRLEMVVAPDVSWQAIRKFEEGKGFSLSAEQKAAIQHVTSETGQIALVRGAAGAGKTTMLEAAKGAWASAGYRVRGAALAGKAAAGLQAVGIQSQTIASLLLAPDQLARAREFLENAWSPAARQKAEERVAELEAAQLRTGDVLVVDEAGMVGSRQMAELAKRCDEAGVKLVLVGDEKQLQAISAGGAFGMLQNNLGFASLSENRRQRQAEDRAAAQSVVNGEALGAIQSYADRGLLTVEKSKEQLKSDLAADYLKAQARDQDKLILTQTRADAADLNSLIHDTKLADGFVINSQSLAAAKGDIDLAEGDRFIFLQNAKKTGNFQWESRYRRENRIFRERYEGHRYPGCRPRCPGFRFVPCWGPC